MLQSLSINLRMNSIKASWFGILGVSLFTVATILGGLQIASYSHISQLISESYAIGTPYGIQLRYLFFFPSGLFIALFTYYAAKALPKSTLSNVGFAGMGVFYGFATIVVSIFPCDQGCNQNLIEPSLSQFIHNLAGLLTYTIVPFCLLILGIQARKWTNGKWVSYSGIAFALISIFFVGTLSSNTHSNFIGLYQRIIEGSILSWILICSFYFSTLHKNHTA